MYATRVLLNFIFLEDYSYSTGAVFFLLRGFLYPTLEQLGVVIAPSISCFCYPQLISGSSSSSAWAVLILFCFDTPIFSTRHFDILLCSLFSDFTVVSWRSVHLSIFRALDLPDNSLSVILKFYLIKKYIYIFEVPLEICFHNFKSWKKIY